MRLVCFSSVNLLLKVHKEIRDQMDMLASRESQVSDTLVAKVFQDQLVQLDQESREQEESQVAHSLVPREQLAWQVHMEALEQRDYQEFQLNSGDIIKPMLYLKPPLQNQFSSTIFIHST